MNTDKEETPPPKFLFWLYVALAVAAAFELAKL